MNQMITDSERQKSLLDITKKLVLFTGISLLIIAAWFYFLIDVFNGQRTYLLLIVFAAGIVGGFVSIQQRLPKADLEKLKELSQSWTSLLLIPLNGGIFAIVLHIIFLSGLLQGSFFPEYLPLEDFNSETLVDDFNKFLTTTFPKNGPNVAKLIFWSFVAGFSERFVPQIIMKTAKQSSETNNSSDSQ